MRLLKWGWLLPAVLLCSGCLEVDYSGQPADFDTAAYEREAMARDSTWIYAMNVDTGQIVIRGDDGYDLAGGTLRLAAGAGSELAGTVGGGTLLVAGHPPLTVEGGELRGELDSDAVWRLQDGFLLVSRRPEVRLRLTISGGALRLAAPPDRGPAPGAPLTLDLLGGRLDADVVCEFSDPALARLAPPLQRRQSWSGALAEAVGADRLREGLDGFLHPGAGTGPESGVDREFFDDLRADENRARADFHRLLAEQYGFPGREREFAERLGARRVAALPPGSWYVARDGTATRK